MVRPHIDLDATPRLEDFSQPATEAEPVDRDERLGEAIEQYMAMAEAGSAPDPEEFVSRFPDLAEDLAAALDGLAMVQGLVGDSGSGPGSRLEAGRRVAGYRIVRELGRGGMGIVYEAVHVDLDRPVALKVLNTHAAPDSTGRRRFLNEAKTAAGLHHTHIVPVFDVGQVGGLCYYAMQRIEGSGLDRVLKSLRKGRSSAAGSGSNKNPTDTISLDLLGGTSIGDPTRSWFGASKSKPAGVTDREVDAPLFEPPRGGEYYRWVARAGVQAAEALAHAHRRGVIHRDVKPSNLLVDARGTVWVADFGLARRLADPAITHTDSMLGTPRYMSPEQTELQPVDGRTDLYSLGTTLYELVTLRPPFDGKSAAELIGQIRDKEPLAPRKIDAKLPRDLETIIMKAMAKRPGDRYAGPTELAEDLNRFLAMEPVKARRIGPVGRAWRFARRHPSLTTVSTVAILAILATASVSHMRVVKERNEAISAKVETSRALSAAEIAKQQMRSAMRNNLWREAVFVRQSSLPERRKTSLARIKEAVALGPDPVLTPRLRDEAVQSLGMGDIVPRDPVDTGSVRRLAFTPDTGRLITLAEDGSSLELWNLDRSEKLVTHPLTPADFQEQGPPWARGAVSLLAAPNGFVATIRPGGDGVRLFDPMVDTKSVDLPLPDRRVTALSATPDGKRLVVVSVPASSSGGGRGVSGKPVVTLWDLDHPDAPLATLAETATVRDPSEMTSPNRRSQQILIACSPDSQTIALAHHLDTEITLWNAVDGSRIGSVATDAFTSSIAIAQGGELAASCGGMIARWDARTMRPLPGLTLHQPFARAIGFSPDGKMLAVATIASSLEIWDPEANTLQASVPTGDNVHDFAFAPDGRSLVAAVKNQTRVWDMVEPIGRYRLAAPETRPASHLVQLSVSPSGVVASSFWNDKTLSARVQCPEGGVSTRDHQNTLVLGFDPAGRLILMGRDYLELYTSARDTSPEMRVALPKMPPDPSFFGRKLDADTLTVQGWARSADGRAMLLFRHSDVLMVRFDDVLPPTITPIKPADPREGWSRSSKNPPRGGPDGEGRREPGGDRGGRGPGPGAGPDLRGRPAGDLRSLVISPQGTRFYTLSERGEPIDREVRGWSIEGDQAVELDLKSLPREIRHIAASPDGRLLALGRFSGEVVLADASTGQTFATIPAVDDADKVTSLAISSEGELAIGTRSGVVRLWSTADPQSPQPLVALPGSGSMVTILAYAANGQRLAVGDNAGADVWDLANVREQLKDIGLGW